jgi:transmembrane sensor
MGNEKAEEIIRKYLEGTATPDEAALLESWYFAATERQPEMAGEPDYSKIEAEILESLRAEQQDLPKLHQPKFGAPVRFWPRMAAAAAVLIILSVGSIYIFHKGLTGRISQHKPLENDILPASSRATLTLLNGGIMTLDSTDSKILTRQGYVTISSRNGQLIYKANEPGKQTSPGSEAYNILTTKRGEHYSLQLPDGTKVWLNAASSITYPVVFNGKERKVTVKGELYFEIAHNASQPFKIAVNNELVEDIGTHLNINAYDDETTINTTLLQGAVKVTQGPASVILKPGQEAIIGPVDNSFQLKEVDADQAISWKNGYFYFDRADIKKVMRELARWYDVQIVYKGDLPKRTFKGKLYRNINASEALGILSYFGAHFQIEGKIITVSS